MQVCLIDADSKIPNLALMRLSTYFKNLGHTVILFQAHLPYYPDKKKVKFHVPQGFDEYYCSCVFTGNQSYIKGNNINFGGTGCNLHTKLPPDVENINPDYDIYPDNDTSYGFISRGCIRKCAFCVVPEKEGYIHQVATISDIVKHKKVKFLDNNILALPQHKEILAELVLSQIKCQFNQGLDIRLIDSENSKLLSKMNYWGEYIFAFDSYSDLGRINEKLALLSWRKPYNLKFYLYCHPDMLLSDIVKRVEWARKNKVLPYFMRDISCWGAEYQDFYTDLAAYCNQVHCFKKMTFSQFLFNRHTKLRRIVSSVKLYRTNQNFVKSLDDPSAL